MFLRSQRVDDTPPPSHPMLCCHHYHRLVVDAAAYTEWRRRRKKHQQEEEHFSLSYLSCMVSFYFLIIIKFVRPFALSLDIYLLFFSHSLSLWANKSSRDTGFFYTSYTLNIYLFLIFYLVLFFPIFIFIKQKKTFKRENISTSHTNPVIKKKRRKWRKKNGNERQRTSVYPFFLLLLFFIMKKIIGYFFFFCFYLFIYFIYSHKNKFI